MSDGEGVLGTGQDHQRELKVAQRAEAHVADVQRGRRRPAVVRARQRQDLQHSHTFELDTTTLNLIRAPILLLKRLLRMNND